MTSCENNTPSPLQALLGQAQCLQRRGDMAAAIEVVHNIVARFPWFLPALTEKAKLLMAAGDWDQALDCVRRVLQEESGNIEALHMSGGSDLILARSLKLLRDISATITMPQSYCRKAHQCDSSRALSTVPQAIAVQLQHCCFGVASRETPKFGSCQQRALQPEVQAAWEHLGIGYWCTCLSCSRLGLSL